MSPLALGIFAPAQKKASHPSISGYSLRMSATLTQLDDFYSDLKPTKAELDFIANKERDLKVYGHYVVTLEELEQLHVAIEAEREGHSMAAKKKTTKKVAKKTAKKVSKKIKK